MLNAPAAGRFAACSGDWLADCTRIGKGPDWGNEARNGTMGQVEAARSREGPPQAEVTRLLAVLEQAGLEPDGTPAGLLAASRNAARHALDRLRETQSAA